MNKHRIVGIISVIFIILICLSGCKGKSEEIHDFNDGIISRSDYAYYDELYEPVLETWKTAVGECFGANLKTEEHKKYPYLPEQIKVSEWSIVDIYYSYYDIDRNGTAELLVAGYGEEYEDKGSGNGCYYLFDIYTLNGSEPVRLMKAVTDSGFERFDNTIIDLSADGTALIWRYSEEENQYKYYKYGYKIADDGITAEKTDLYGEKYAVYGKLQWNLLAKQAFSNIDYSKFIDTTYREYPDAPTAYWNILNDYRQSVELTDCMGKCTSGDVFYELFCGKETVDFGISIDGFYAEEKGDIYIEAMQNEKDVFGYGVYDINHDGIPELLLMTNKSDGTKSIWDIYSIYDGKAKCLIGFHQRAKCYGISEEGSIYCHHSNASYFQNEVYHILDGGGYISFEKIYADNPRGTDSNTVEFDYTYYFNDRYDPDSEPESIRQEMSAEAGAAAAERLHCDYNPDVAPFISFIPLFDQKNKN